MYWNAKRLCDYCDGQGCQHCDPEPEIESSFLSLVNETPPEKGNKMNLPDGYYVLDYDVDNPVCDRRMSGWMGKKVWPHGTRFRIYTVKPFEHPYQNLEIFNSSTSFPLLSHLPDSIKIIEAVLPYLKPAPQTLGQILDTTHSQPSIVLATLLEQGKIDLASVQSAAQVDYDDDNYQQLEKRHWI